MSDRMRLTVVKCPNCGDICEPYDDDLYICESCGTLVEPPVEKKVVEIRNKAKVERIRFEIRQYEDKRSAEEAEHELMKAYANMPFLKKVLFHLSLSFEEFSDWFHLHTGRNLAILFTALLIIAAIIYLTGK